MDESNKINKTLLILDGFAVIFRVYYSRQPMSTSTGITTTIVQGFLSVLFKLINDNNLNDIIKIANIEFQKVIQKIRILPLMLGFSDVFWATPSAIIWFSYSH